LAILTLSADPTRTVGMRGRDSTSIKSSQSAQPAALIALVRLLARQVARDFVVETSAPSDSQKRLQPDDRK
jgi:hypothetical protein